jgi:hypothetical protein
LQHIARPRYCCERMGQNFPSDLELIGWLSERVVAGGENFLSGDASTRPESVILESTALRAEISWITDYEKSGDRSPLQMMIRLKRRGSGGHRDRFIYIRYGSASSRLQHAKTWRIAFSGLSKIKEQRPHRKLKALQISRDLYWTPTVPCDDIRAQIIIAMTQFRMVGNEPLQWLTTEYLCRFRIRTPLGFESNRFRKDCRETVAADLIRFWTFPESYRAFRKYVFAKIKRFVSSERLTVNVNAGHDMNSWSYETGSKPEFEKKLGHIPPTISEAVPHIPSRGAENRVVRDAAIELKCSERYVYRLIHLHSLNVHDDHSRMVLPTSEFEKLRQILEERRLRRAEVMMLRRRGKSYAAARKSIYRWHKSRPV